MEALMFILRLKSAIILCAAFLTLLIVMSCDEDSPNEPNGSSQTITVNGFVKDANAEPVAGVTVIIKGKAPTTTDANGGFSISDVTKPYEIRVLMSTQQVAIIYQGLTRSDPSLLYFGDVAPWKSATITGIVPPAVGKITEVFFISGTKVFYTIADEATGSYTIYADWRGSENSFTGKLQVLRWTQNSSGMPVQYDAYGYEDNLTISAGGTFNNHNFTAGSLTDPAEQNISGTIVRPSSSYELFGKNLYLNFGSIAVNLGGESGVSLTDNFSYVVPSLAGATFGVDVWGVLFTTPNSRYTAYWKRGIAGGSSVTTINLSSSPQLNLPAHNGSGIDTTTQFLWTKGTGGGISYVIIEPTVSGMGPTFYIFTGENTTSIPNLAPQGLGLPSNVAYTWGVAQYFPISSINDAASTSLIQLAYRQTEGGMADSGEFTFTTKP